MCVNSVRSHAPVPLRFCETPRTRHHSAGLGARLVSTHARRLAVWTAATTVGWSGFALLCLATLLVFLIMGPAWYVLLPASFGLRGWPFIWARMVRDAASDALPFSQVGGFVLGARAAILHGVSSRVTVASMIVDVITEMLAQIAYIALGAMVLMTRVPHTPTAR